MFKLQLEEQIWTKTYAQRLVMCRKNSMWIPLFLKKKSLKEEQLLLSHTEKDNIVRKKEKHLKLTLHLTLQDGI